MSNHSKGDIQFTQRMKTEIAPSSSARRRIRCPGRCPRSCGGSDPPGASGDRRVVCTPNAPGDVTKKGRGPVPYLQDWNLTGSRSNSRQNQASGNWYRHVPKGIGRNGTSNPQDFVCAPKGCSKSTPGLSVGRPAMACLQLMRSLWHELLKEGSLMKRKLTSHRKVLLETPNQQSARNIGAPGLKGKQA